MPETPSPPIVTEKATAEVRETSATPEAPKTPETPRVPKLTDAPEVDANLQSIERGYKHIMRIYAVLSWGIPATVFTIVDVLVLAEISEAFHLAMVLGWAIALTAIVSLPARRYLRWGYAMSGDCIRITRGYFFRTDTIVPFVRVQHIDIEQGILERIFGLSSMVIRTSGTYNNYVTLPGLLPSDAAAMRDLIRSRIQSDYQ